MIKNIFIKSINFNYDFYNNCKNNPLKILEYNIDIDENKFPFKLDSFIFFKSGGKINFSKSVNFFVGGNGTGKTSFIESFAYKLDLNKFGGGIHFTLDESEKPVFSDFLSLSRGLSRPDDLFFLRAENFFNLQNEIDKHDGRSFYTSDNTSYREMSHGQGFKTFFENRLGTNGIYIFDEPESALSADSQIDFLFYLKELSNLGNQIFIVTHSPIILSFPDCDIFDVEDNFNKIKYSDTSQFRDYLNFFKNVRNLRERLSE